MKSNLLLICIYFLAKMSYAQTPYASYPLDGNANDISGNALHGTFGGSPTATSNRNGQQGKALLFNGTTDYIEMPTDFDFPSRSVIVWFYATKVGSANNANIIYASDHPNLQNGLTGILTFRDSSVNFGGTNTTVYTTDRLKNYATMDLNRWYQAAIVRTPSEMKAYLNGVLISTRATPDNYKSNNTISYHAIVGADRGYLAKFEGKIDDLKIYNYAVDDSVILQDYNNGKVITYDTVHVSVTDTLYIDATLTGIPPYGLVNTLKVYPNPAKDHIYINSGDYTSMSGYSLKISNSLAQDVFTTSINQQLFYVDLNGWSGSGVYTLTILNNQQQVIATKKIVIQ